MQSVRGQVNEAASERSERRDRTGCRACGAETQKLGEPAVGSAGEELPPPWRPECLASISEDLRGSGVAGAPHAHEGSRGRMGREAFEGQNFILKVVGRH